jgi:membrane-bound serine protease (ClpP class)
MLMATQDFLVPQTIQQWQILQANGLSVLIALCLAAGLLAIQVFWFDTIPGISRLQLRPEEYVQPSVNASDPASGRPGSELQVGQAGVCQCDLRPSGKVMFGATSVDVLTEGDYVERGQSVKIIRIEGNIVTVRPE